MQNKRWGNAYRQTVVCVDTYRDGIPTGRFYNPYFPEGKAFSSLTRFLTGMEDALDEMQFPQSFAAVRTFLVPGEREQAPPPGAECVRSGALATFAVRILFRQNASWQGSITWLEGEVEQSFRSVLELILLMDSALAERVREVKNGE